MSLKPINPSFPTSYNSKKLIKYIFDSETPKKIVESLPSQTLYMLILSQGLESSSELISLSSKSQYTLILDYLFWEKDTFNEEEFWHFIDSVDEQNSLVPLERFLFSIEKELLAIIISRNAEFLFFEEPTDRPPEAPFYTPDKGFTWVGIKIKDEERHKKMGKVLALLFEKDPDLFYKLSAMSKVSTQSELEEYCYQLKSKRLLAEGIPDMELAFKDCSPVKPNIILKKLSGNKKREISLTNKSITPFVYEKSYYPKPLEGLIREITSKKDKNTLETFEKELTYITNTSIIRFSISLNESEEIYLLMKKIRGAINIGFESILKKEKNLTLFKIYNILGLNSIYRLGLYYIFELKNIILKIKSEDLEKIKEDEPLFSLIDMLKEPFPSLPEFFKKEEELIKNETLMLSLKRTQIEHIKELEKISLLLSEFSLI